MHLTLFSIFLLTLLNVKKKIDHESFTGSLNDHQSFPVQLALGTSPIPPKCAHVSVGYCWSGEQEGFLCRRSHTTFINSLIHSFVKVLEGIGALWPRTMLLPMQQLDFHLIFWRVHLSVLCFHKLLKKKSTSDEWLSIVYLWQIQQILIPELADRFRNIDSFFKIFIIK